MVSAILVISLALVANLVLAVSFALALGKTVGVLAEWLMVGLREKQRS